MTSEAVRAHIASAPRIVVKVGSSSLTRAGGGLDVERVDALVKEIAARRTAGH